MKNKLYHHHNKIVTEYQVTKELINNNDKKLIKFTIDEFLSELKSNCFGILIFQCIKNLKDKETIKEFIKDIFSLKGKYHTITVYFEEI